MEQKKYSKKNCLETPQIYWKPFINTGKNELQVG